ncbi:hypothetical protein [Polaromonas sp.]|uniref:hypothetical protein n=1 Tax=Polaromonas sp. TaxID=1869339 RepID=UPI003563434C
MAMVRTVLPEILDGLGPHDPRAQRSRKDLQRLHRAMGTQRILLDALRKMPLGRTGSQSSSPLNVLEIGAGDGSLMLGVARALQSEWPAVSLTLLDQLNLLEPATVKRYANARWDAHAEVINVIDWAKPNPLVVPTPAKGRWDLIVANLFLHHFEGPQLTGLLTAIAARTDCFFACEPHRAWLALAGSHLVGFVGANAVTRQDAVLSVHAGFRLQELGSLWPDKSREWTHKEYSAGLFSHCFCAVRA